ncbi:hypothetical protein SAMD00019534_120610 [Acytostelium subglobosum LB1]|uniref:hypothetical protein n=1 Tax=Acytostelium subglobosum LB1 TaxID=1410327 RepID=UPI0006447CD6|nr:hypothetical protein SAMD00019534_120610 [Acytostelium subglobosum LB1]GAM28885.1 hypothetical protein SAMD00019534_120610 [Acytostelium subglobosum LB1]|eukprot:XP_012748257.1 hypothetical protein SAMD00019534_120610 [Acytostelium subglobosum LB1]
MIVYRTLDNANELSDYHDLTCEQFDRVQHILSSESIFDFKNNLRCSTDLISTILNPNDFTYIDDTWIYDKSPLAIVHEYYSTCGGGKSFNPVKIEMASAGPYACIYNIPGSTPTRTMASGIYPQLKKAQANLAHKVLIYFCKRQQAMLNGTPFNYDEHSFDELQEAQDKYNEEKKIANEKRQQQPQQQQQQMVQDEYVHVNKEQQQTEQQQTEQTPAPVVDESNNDYIVIFDKFKLPRSCTIVNLSKDELCKKFIIQEGRKDYPQFASKVAIKYSTHLLDGTLIDETNKTEYFEIGVSSLTRGLELALFNMKEKEKCLVVVPPEYAYGERGAPPLIPPNQTLVYHIENVTIQYKSTPDQLIIDTMPVRDRLNQLKELRDEGKRSFINHHYGRCLKVYKNALKYLSLHTLGNVTEDEWQEIHEHGASICVNLAVCYASMSPPVWDRVRDYGLMGLDFADDNPKMYYWIARGYYQLGTLDLALENIDKSLAYGGATTPDPKATQLKKTITHDIQKNKVDEMKMFTKIFEEMGKQE